MQWVSRSSALLPSNAEARDRRQKTIVCPTGLIHSDYGRCGAAMVLISLESFKGVFIMLGTCKAAVVFALAAGLASLSCVPAHAQGCIVARSSSMDMAPETEGGYLDPGDWSVAIGYRHQFSYEHFVGNVEQTYRVQQGTEVMNKINLEGLNLSYQAKSRISVTLAVPLLFAMCAARSGPGRSAAVWARRSCAGRGWIGAVRRLRRRFRR